MNKKITISIIIVVALVVAGILWLSSGSPVLAPTETPSGTGNTSPPSVSAEPSSVLPSAPQPGTSRVAIQNFAFAPATLTVPVGTQVIWTNQDSTPHTVTASNGAFNSGALSTGSEFSFILNQAGSYDYHCSIHPSMLGKIIVQ
jgi:plastocyanin